MIAFVFLLGRWCEEEEWISCMFRRFFRFVRLCGSTIALCETLARLRRAKHHHQIMKPKAKHSNHSADSGATHLCWVIPRDFLSQVPTLHAGWLPKTLIDDVCQNTSPLKYQHYFFGIQFASLLVAVMTTSDSLVLTPKFLIFKRSVQHTLMFLLHILQEATLGFVSVHMIVCFFPWHGKIKDHHQSTV